MCYHGKKEIACVILEKGQLPCTIRERKGRWHVLSREKRQIACAITEKRQKACAIMEEKATMCYHGKKDREHVLSRKKD